MFFHLGFKPCRLYTINILYDIFYRTVFQNQLCCSLFAYTRYTWYIVGFISHQTLEINKLPGCKAVSVNHGLSVINIEFRHTFFSKDDFSDIRRQLQLILVPCNDIWFEARSFSFSGYRSDNIISFKPFNLYLFYIHSCKYILEDRYLHSQLRRHFLPPGLIILIFSVPESRCLHIECDCHIFRFIITSYFFEHIDKAENTLCEDTFFSYHGVTHCIISPVYQTVSINNSYSFHYIHPLPKLPVS